MPKVNKNQILLKDVYKFYKNSVENPVDYATHKLILDTWGLAFCDYLVVGKEVKLQRGLALLVVIKKIQKTFVDYKQSKVKKTEVSKSNIHSGFYVASLRWARHSTKFFSKGWAFKSSRHLKGLIKDQMLKKDGHTMYLVRAGVHNTMAKEKYKSKILAR